MTQPAAPGTETGTAPGAAPASAPATERSRRAAGSALTLVPGILVIIAEAAWISVVGGLVEEFSLHSPSSASRPLALVVTAGAIAARTLGPRAGARWPFVAFGSGRGRPSSAGSRRAPPGRASARASDRRSAPIRAACLPGSRCSGASPTRVCRSAESTLTHMLALGAPGLAFAALVGGIIGEPYRSRFLGDTLAASILFVGCTVLALAFARLGAIGDDQGLDWRHNPSWLALTLGLLIGAIAAVAAAGVRCGPGHRGPDRVLDRADAGHRPDERPPGGAGASCCFLAILVGISGSARFSAIRSRPSGPPGAPGQARRTRCGEPIATIGWGASSSSVLAADPDPGRALDAPVATSRRPRGGDADVRPRRARALWSGRRRRWRRRLEPANAAEAYVALLADLDGRPGVRRDEAETPREHAARLRASGADLSLDLLAADYALVRDGGRTLSRARTGAGSTAGGRCARPCRDGSAWR